MTLYDQLTTYVPYNEQEARDCGLILHCLQNEPNIFTRENRLAHITASAWIVNPGRDQALMAYHNIYHSWSWLGGHADGETDLLAVAIREAREESGIRSVRSVMGDVFSVESLTVDGHMKRGVYVSSHLHLNVTYLLEADEHEALFAKPDENSGVKWFGLDEAVQASCEPWFRAHVYQKLVEKVRKLEGETFMRWTASGHL